MLAPRILCLAAISTACAGAAPRTVNAPVVTPAVVKNASKLDEYNQRGIAHFNAKEPERAIEAFSAMIATDPENFRGYINLAFVLVSQQRYEEAERAARRAVDLRKLDMRARYLLGLSLSSQRKNLQEAEDNLAAATAEVAEARLELSRLLIEKGDFTQAMKELEQFTQQNKQMGGLQLLAK